MYYLKLILLVISIVYLLSLIITQGKKKKSALVSSKIKVRKGNKKLLNKSSRRGLNHRMN